MKIKTLALILFSGLIIMTACKDGNLNSSSGEIIYSKRLIDISSLGPGFLESMNEKLYNAVLEGRVSAYQNDSLLENSKLSKEDAKRAGSIEEAIQLAPDPKIPDYIVDTVIINYVRLSDIVGYEISDACSFNKGSNIYSVTPNAFAITHKQTIAGIELNEKPIFWIPYDELKGIIGSDNFSSLNELLYKKAMERLADF